MEEKCLLPNDEFYQFATPKLLEILENGLLLERGRALFVLARRSGGNEELIKKVLNEIYDAKNRNTKTIGIVSISFLGIAGLLEVNTNDTKEIVKKILDSWIEPERNDLILFLNSMYRKF
ncbi:hypothetical protein [Nostoc sp. CMAA1605]|uniref:hypothetical protein n=1 Tax=Nostoc sp. CMAA1605 TaxID=2055159 RepID=UPI001F229E4A|nr:hypothetical protein [Nostoc sp. CMAA1605]MCF4968144.1 hypothetical protein [Nostoc sp. CMAA1605]